MTGLEVIFPTEAVSNDPEGRSLLRAIQAHEFSMTGGVRVGEREGKLTYSDPIDHHDPKWAIKCPWHEGDCTAWDEIVAGRGKWTRMEDELKAARAKYQAGVDKLSVEKLKKLHEQITNLEWQLDMRPRDAKALRERTPEMIREEKAKAEFTRSQNKRKMADSLLEAQRAIAKLNGEKFEEPVSETTKSAVSNLSGDVPDEIIIDGEEEGE